MNNPLPTTERPLTNSQLLRLYDAVDSHPIPLTDELVQSLDEVQVSMKIGKTTLVVPVSFGAAWAIADQDHTYIKTLYRLPWDEAVKGHCGWGCVVNGTFQLEGQTYGVGDGCHV